MANCEPPDVSSIRRGNALRWRTMPVQVNLISEPMLFESANANESTSAARGVGAVLALKLSTRAPGKPAAGTSILSS
jgi:hypothetical protein